VLAVQILFQILQLHISSFHLTLEVQDLLHIQFVFKTGYEHGKEDPRPRQRPGRQAVRGLSFEEFEEQRDSW
jgi:hypothetical protein